jgi:two-component system cell cycle sensor histidine kinase/response regulator CckA
LSDTGERESGLVLVIDDDQEIRDFCGMVLSDHGYSPILAADGNEGLAAIGRNNHFDVVVTDLVMPGREGMEFIREIHKRFPDIGIVCMSGDINSGAYLKIAEALGATIALLKPFESAELLAAVKTVSNRN